MCKVGAVKAREDGQECAHQVPLEAPWKGVFIEVNHVKDQTDCYCQSAG